MAVDIQRVTSPDDPNRCQGVTSDGQCLCVATIGEYCRIHAVNGERKENKNKIRNYRLEKWQNRVNEFSDSDQIKSLREEIGITRMLIEEIFARCQNSTELILMSGKISDLIMKCEKLVSSCHRLEQSTGSLLNKEAVIQLAGVMVEIISEHVTDSDALDQISNKIMDTIQTSVEVV